MERGERIRLEAIKRNLEGHLKTIKDLLRKASAPRRRSKKEVSKRALAICRTVAQTRRPVTDGELRKIVKKHGIPYASVGALYAAKYLERSKRGVALGDRGRAAIVSREQGVRPGTKKRSGRARRPKKTP